MSLRTDRGPGLVDWVGDDLDGAARTNSRTGPGGSSRDATDLFSMRGLFYNGTATAIVLGDVVQHDIVTSGFVKGKWIAKSAATDDIAVAFGVAAEAIAAGDYGEVIIKGYVPVVAMKTGVSAGDAVQASDDAAGRVETAAALTDRALGVALSAASSNLGSMWIY